MRARAVWAALCSTCCWWYDLAYGIGLGTFGYMLDGRRERQRQANHLDQGGSCNEHGGESTWQIEGEEFATLTAAE